MDNKHLVGSVVALLTNPEKHVRIKKYLNRIYYCMEVGNENERLLALFDRELIPIPIK